MRVFCAGFNLYGQFLDIDDKCIESFKSIEYSDAIDIQISHSYLIIKTKENSCNETETTHCSKILLHGFIENKSHASKEILFDTNISQMSFSDSKSLFLSSDGNIFNLNNVTFDLSILPDFTNIEQSEMETNDDYITKIATSSINCFAYSKHGLVFSIPSKLDCKIPNVKDIYAGKEHCIILTENGHVYSFGGGSRGQLGHGDVEDRFEPKLVESLSGIKIIKVACGSWHTIALSAEGDIYVWGWNSNGQLGLQTNKNETNDDHKVAVMASPVVLELEGNVIDITCGARHTIALFDDSKLYGCGWNKYFQLGLNSIEENVYGLIFLHDFSNFNVVGLRCGTWNTAVLTS